MISLVELYSILVLYSFNLFHYAFLKDKLVFSGLLADHFAVLFHLMVEFFHLLVTNDLLFEELVLPLVLFDDVKNAWVHAILLESVKMHSADIAFTAHLLTLLKKVWNVCVCLLSSLHSTITTSWPARSLTTCSFGLGSITRLLLILARL